MIWAIIKTTFEGLHQWKNAPKEIIFLRNLHRHIFYIELWIEQKHTERDIEYISEKQELNKHLEEFESWYSCEAFAKIIKAEWEKRYPDRKIKVSVWEDNENGCLLE